MKISLRGMVGIFLAFLLVIGLVLITQGQAAAADKPKVLNFGVIGDFSGPYAPIVGQTRPGAEDAWDYINSELGGIKGVKGHPIILDMTGKIDLGLNMYNQVINTKPKPLFVDIYITPLSEALRPRYVEDDVVGFHAGAVVSLYPQANSYSLYPLYPEMVGAVIKYVRDQWKEKRPMKIGIITWDTSYGKAILTKEFFDYLKEIGVEVVTDPQVFGIREVDMTPQLMKLRAANPDYLVTNSAAGGALAIERNLKDMGWEIDVLNTAGLDWGTARLDLAAFEGNLVSLPTASFDETDNQGIQTMMKYFKKNNRTVKDISIFYILAWQCALIEHKVMTEVVDKYGWEGLNIKNLKEGINNLKDFQPLGGLSRITYTDKRRTPHYVQISKCTNGKFIPVTGWFEVKDMMPPEFK